MSIHSCYGSFPHSLLGTSEKKELNMAEVRLKPVDVAGAVVMMRPKMESSGTRSCGKLWRGFAPRCQTFQKQAKALCNRTGHTGPPN